MKNDISKPEISLEEWNFRMVPDDQMYACQWWEYARESARIRAFFQNEDSDLFPSPGWEPEVKRADGSVMLPARRHLINPLRMRFAAILRDYALPLIQIIERLQTETISDGTLDPPWQVLPKETRHAVAEDIAPLFSKMPWLTYLPFNRCSDMRDIGIADENYCCAHLDSKTGIERFRVEIDWGGFTNWQIVEAFRRWVNENRPHGLGRTDDRGKRKRGGIEAQLKSLGILRLMNAYSFTSLHKKLPDAWKHYRSMDWPRARHNALKTFRRLFFFLPEDDLPLHWPTAGGRAK